MTDIQWAYTKCPVCGLSYPYIANGYKPRTCNNYDCIHKFIHNRIQETILEWQNEGGDAQQTERN